MSPIPPEHDNVSSYGNLQQPSSKTVEGKLPLEENSVQIDGFVYNATRLAEIHPGGDLFVKVGSITALPATSPYKFLLRLFF